MRTAARGLCLAVPWSPGPAVSVERAPEIASAFLLALPPEKAQKHTAHRISVERGSKGRRFVDDTVNARMRL